MHLARNVDTEELAPSAVVRTSPWPHGAVFLVCLLPPVLLAAFRGGELAALSWWTWLVAAPFALLFGALWLAMLSAFWLGFRAGFEPSNWIAKRTEDGLWLQLRSFLNWAIEDDEDTALFLRLEELESMRRVTRTSHARGGEHVRSTRESFLELRLVDGCDLAPVAAAIERERQREGAETPALGGKGRIKHHDSPVRVEGERTLRVQWRRPLFELLQAAGVPVVDPGTEVRGLPERRAAA